MTSNYFTMQTEQLTKCVEPLQKARARLRPLHPQVHVILYHSPFAGGTANVVRRGACYGVSVCTIFTFYVSRRILVRF